MPNTTNEMNKDKSGDGRGGGEDGDGSGAGGDVGGAGGDSDDDHYDYYDICSILIWEMQYLLLHLIYMSHYFV
jgi:hypothetical protein